MANWKARTFLAADKVILIKSNFTGIPQYSINWFKFLKYIYMDINGLNKFFFFEKIIVIITTINIGYVH